MIYGTVDYVLKDDRKSSIDWAARANLVKDGGVVKMEYYQVYLVSLRDLLFELDELTHSRTPLLRPLNQNKVMNIRH